MSLTGQELIHNLGLGLVGEFGVEDTAASRALKQNLLCIRYYPSARDLTLRAHPWNEAKKRVVIAQTSDEPVFGYDRRYSVPSDSLRVLSVNDDLGADVRLNFSGVDAWEVEGDYILANAGLAPPTWKTSTDYIIGQFVTNSSVTYSVAVTHTSDDFDDDVTDGNLVTTGGDYRIVYVEYIYQLTDIDSFSPKLKQAIAMKLAIKVVVPLMNDIKGKAALIQEFETLTMPKARSVDAQQGKPRKLFSSEWLRSRTWG